MSKSQNSCRSTVCKGEGTLVNRNEISGVVLGGNVLWRGQMEYVRGGGGGRELSELRGPQNVSRAVFELGV